MENDGVKFTVYQPTIIAHAVSLTDCSNPSQNEHKWQHT